MERQINMFNRLFQKQEGNITYYKKGNIITCAGNPLTPPASEEYKCRQHSPSQACQSPSPSNSALAITAPDNCHNSQLGGESRVTTVPGSSATSSPDNTSSDAGDLGPRHESTTEVPQLQPQPGPPTLNLGHLGYSCHQGETT